MNNNENYSNNETPRYSSMLKESSKYNNPKSKTSEREVSKNYVEEDRKSRKRFDDEDDYEEEKPREKIVYRDREGGMPGCVKGCGCRSLSCGGCLLAILVIVGFFYVLINKPPIVWKEVINYLNNSVAIPKFNGMTSQNAKDQINSSAEASGFKTVTIDENELTAIVRDNFKQLDNATVDLEPDTLRIYWNLDKTIQDNPLIGVMEIKMDKDGKLNLTKVGTERVALPDFMNQLVSNLVPSVLSISSSDKDKTQVIYNLLSSNQNFKIKGVKLEKDKLNLEISIDLFNK